MARTLTYRVEGRRFESDGARIHFTDEGRGVPVVLLHGFAVNADLNWRWPRLTQSLRREFRVIAIDLRGHGLSDKPHGVAHYGLKMVGDVVHLLDHLAIRTAHVAGYSLGGFVALKLAAVHPERLRSAAILGAGWERPDHSAFMDAIAHLAAELEAGRAIGPLSAHLGEERRAPSLLHTLWVRFMTKFMNDPRALVGVIRGTPELALTEEELRRIALPICSIVGSEDPLANGAAEMRGRVSDLTRCVVEGADHVRATMRPELRAALLEFLRSH